METFFCVLLLAQSRFQITFKKGKLPDFSLLFLSIKMTYSNTLVYCNNECCADLYLTLQDNCSSSRLVIICFYEIVNAMLLIRLFSRWFLVFLRTCWLIHCPTIPWESWQTGFSRWSRNWHQKVIPLQPLSSQLWSLLPDHQHRQRVLSRVLSGTTVLRIDLVVKKFTCVEKSMKFFFAITIIPGVAFVPTRHLYCS